MKSIDLQKLNRALDILDKVHDAVDPNAFIAGGLPASLYLGVQWSTDIDVFLSSPNFDVDGLGKSAFAHLKAVFPDIRETNRERYWYNKRFCRIATLNGVDFIQVSKAPANYRQYVLDKFDINVCKITMTGSKNDYRASIGLYPTDEFLKGIEDKTIIYNTNLADYRYESEAQAEVTLTRLEKYKERFPGFAVKKAGER